MSFNNATEDGALYTCTDSSNLECPNTCVSLADCEGCDCATVDTGGGPWGKAMDVILCLLPIFFLLVVTLKPNPMPTTRSLPMAALIMFLVRTMYLGSDPLLCSAAIISGLHEALSPITIMAGAIFLFETMEATLCMPYMMREMKHLTNGHSLSELMLLFGFCYMVEGASGFGTPVALGAPMLVSLGYDKFTSVVTLLLMNTFATVWGAAGTPIWFGFGNLGLSNKEFVDVSYKSGVALAFGAYLLLPFVLLFACTWARLKESKWFLLSSLSTVILPSLGLSFVAYEFPALIGGMVGCCLTAVLIYFKVGIKQVPHHEEEGESGRHPLDITASTSPEFSIIEQYKDSQRRQDKVSWRDGDKDKTESMTDGRDVNGSEEEKNDESDDGAQDKVDEAMPEEPDVERGIDTAVGAQDKGEEATSEEPDVETGIDTAVEANSGDSSKEAEATPQDIFVDAASSFHDGDDDKPGLTDSARAIEMHLGPRKAVGEGYVKELIGRTFPLWGTVLILIITRIPQIGLRDILNAKEPSFSIFFQTYGTFKCSASLVLQLENILTYPNLNWKYEVLYIPFILPFCVVSFLTMLIYRKDLQCRPRHIIQVVSRRIVNPAIALFGALVLVQLMIKDGPAAPASIIGIVLSDAFKGGWIAIAALIGALGSFFSGSTTISNLTFGQIQELAAQRIGVSTTAMLALQATGASAGNGVCLNNIIAACTVVGLNIGEGQIIGKTWKIVLGSCVISTLSTLAFFIRFN